MLHYNHQTNGIYHTATYNKVGMVYLYIEGSQVIVKKNLFLKMYFVLANSADPDEMPHDVAFHLGLHCLPSNLFRGFWSTKG